MFENKNLTFEFLPLYVEVGARRDTHRTKMALMITRLRNEGKTMDTFVAKNSQAYFPLHHVPSDCVGAVTVKPTTDLGHTHT